MGGAGCWMMIWRSPAPVTTGSARAVVEALRGRVPQDAVLVVSDGEPARMLDLWRGADAVGGELMEALVQKASPAG